MWGNCLIFAIPDFVKNGGELYIEFWEGFRFPKLIHFTVQRNGVVYDFGNGKEALFKNLWFDGEKRWFYVEKYKRFPCKRKLIAKRRITTAPP